MQKEAQLLCGCSSALFLQQMSALLCDTSTFPVRLAQSCQLLFAVAYFLQHVETSRHRLRDSHADAFKTHAETLKSDGLYHKGNMKAN